MPIHHHLLYFLLMLLLLILKTHQFSMSIKHSVPLPPPPPPSFSPSSSCIGENSKRRIIYARTGGGGQNELLLLADSPAPLLTLTGPSLEECAKNCTENSECRSFQFNSEQLDCILLATADSHPTFTGESQKENKPKGKDGGGGGGTNRDGALAHFQRICISSDHLCPSAYAFERYPRHMLVGHALESLLLANVSECLSACLDAKQRFRIDCRSAMYFYEKGLCLLNREQARNVPEGIFRRMENHHGDGDGIDEAAMVDYFDNLCTDTVCGNGAELHWLQTEHFKIDPSREVVLLGKSFEECRQICIENRVHGMVFPCRAFVYSSAKKQCQLSAETGMLAPKVAKKRRRKHRRHMKMDVRATIASLTNFGSSEHFELDSELSTFSAGQYYEKICVEPIDDLRKEAGDLARGDDNKYYYECNDEASFEFYPGKMLQVKEMKILPFKSLSDCLWACLLDGDCRSVQIKKNSDECILSPGTQLASPHAFRASPNVDYYENLCSSTKSSTTGPNNTKSSFAQVALASPNVGKRATTEKRQRPIMAAQMKELDIGNSISNSDIDTATLGEFGENATTSNTPTTIRNSSNVTLETDCRLSDIQVHAKFASPSTGTLFLRDHAGTCSANFRKSLLATLSLSMPSNLNDAKCPGKELAPRHWSYIVVLQQKLEEEEAEEEAIDALQMNILMGQERIFNVTCDFRNTTKTVSNDSVANAPPFENGTGNNNNINNNNGDDDGDGNDKRMGLILEQIDRHPISLQMALFRAGKPVSAVSLGEELELRWNFEEEEEGKGGIGGGGGGGGQMPKLGMFVDSCTAERLDGNPPNPSPLALIVDGCPEPRVHAARLIPSPIRRLADGSIETTLRVFRFDGSRRVRIQCAVDICVEQCPPANCSEMGEIDENYGRRRRRRRRGTQEEDEDVGLTTLGELAELVQRYDRLRNGDVESEEQQERHKSARNGLVQKSTTISGSYTITDDNEDGEENENGEQQEKPAQVPNVLTRPTGKRPSGGHQKGGDGEGMDLMRLLKTDKKKANEGQDKEVVAEIPIAFLGGKKKMIGADEAKKSACQAFSPIPDPAMTPSSLCINRPLGALAIITLAILATLQIFQLVQYIRRQMTVKGKANNESEDINLPEPHAQPPFTREFIGDEITFRHMTTCAHCQQEDCCGDCPRHFSQCADGVEQNRRQSILSVSAPIMIRPIPQPRQTVFPAEPSNMAAKMPSRLEHLSF